ncbi:MAG: hypothetical protein GY757_32420, partial [bacterium]|nr:hypothetical protein [bacterium]
MKAFRTIKGKTFTALSLIAIIFAANFVFTFLYTSDKVEPATVILVQSIGFILFLITGVVLFSIILKQVIKPVSAMGEVFERAAGGELA